MELYNIDGVKVYRYTSEDKGLELVETHPYFVNKDCNYGRFKRVPFIPIKYNADMTSLLQDIKPQVDAYDKIISEVANNIIDIPNSIMLVKGLDGSNPNEVNNFVKNLKSTRLMFSPPEGDGKNLHAKQNNEPIRKDKF